jgi:hypothetical protein
MENAHMMERTTRKTVQFLRPAILAGISGELPAGSYEVDTDEEMIPGLSFQAYRRVRTTIIVPGRSLSSASRQVVEIDPDDLAAALARDALTASVVRP